MKTIYLCVTKIYTKSNELFEVNNGSAFESASDALEYFLSREFNPEDTLINVDDARVLEGLLDDFQHCLVKSVSSKAFDFEYWIQTIDLY